MDPRPVTCTPGTPRAIQIIKGGAAIAFKPCDTLSHNSGDVANVYCGRCHRHVLGDLHHQFWLHRDSLPMWTIFERQRDFPDVYVARLFLAIPSVIATACFISHENIEALRAMMPPGAARLMRSPGDEPQIVETWL